MTMQHSQAFTPAPLGIEERKQPRVPLHLPAILIAPGDVRSAIVITDLSSFGCQIATGERVTVGRYLGIQIPGFSPYAGWVAWQSRDAFGLDFANPLPAAVVAHISGLGEADPAPAIKGTAEG